MLSLHALRQRIKMIIIQLKSLELLIDNRNRLRYALLAARRKKLSPEVIFELTCAYVEARLKFYAFAYRSKHRARIIRFFHGERHREWYQKNKPYIPAHYTWLYKAFIGVKESPEKTKASS
jgi:hypothetical protein